MHSPAAWLSRVVPALLPGTLAGLILLTLLPVLAAAEAGRLAWKPWLLLDTGSDSALALACPADGRTLAAAGSDGEVRIWETTTGEQRTILHGNDVGAPRALAYSADGRLLWLAGRDGAVCWDAASGRQSATFSWGKAKAQLAVFSPGAALAAVAEEDGTVSVWDLAARKELCRLQAQAEGVSALAFAPGAALLAAGSADGTVRLWELPAGKEKLALRLQSEGMVRGLAFSPDGRLLVAAARRSAITAWQLSGKQGGMATMGQARTLHSLAFSPNGRLIAAGSLNGIVEVREVAGAGGHGDVRAHAGLVHQVLFLDGRTLASAGADGLVRVHDSGRLVARRAGKLSSDELMGLVKDLHNEDNEAQALRSMLALASVPDQAVPLLREQLSPRQPPPDERLARLIADLDDSRYRVRDAAAKELEQAGPLVRPALRKALGQPKNLEVRRRLALVLEHLDRYAESRARLAFALRSVVVLERMGTPEAWQLLAALAVGAFDEEVAEQARTAVLRLPKR